MGVDRMNAGTHLKTNEQAYNVLICIALQRLRNEIPGAINPRWNNLDIN